MKIAIVYTSLAHGNTEKVAEAMTDETGADLIKTADANAEALAGFDLIGFGSGIYNSQHDKRIFDLVAGMRPSQAQRVFTFSTSGYGVTKPNEKLNKELKAKGFNFVGTFACKGFDTYGVNKLYGGAAKGHPDEEDLKLARAFVKNLAS